MLLAWANTHSFMHQRIRLGRPARCNQVPNFIFDSTAAFQLKQPTCIMMSWILLLMLLQITSSCTWRQLWQWMWWSAAAPGQRPHQVEIFSRICSRFYRQRLPAYWARSAQASIIHALCSEQMVLEVSQGSRARLILITLVGPNPPSDHCQIIKISSKQSRVSGADHLCCWVLRCVTALCFAAACLTLRAFAPQSCSLS